MLKEYQKICIKIVVFSAIFLFLVQKIGYFLRGSIGEHNWEAFYKIPKNSLDAVFIGSSNVVTHIIPAVLWKDYGIKSYNIGVGRHPSSATYHNFIETYKYQKNAVFVIDVYTIATGEGQRDKRNKFYISFNHNNHGEMNFSINKIKAVKKYDTPIGFKMGVLDILPYLFPIIQFHDEWKNVDKIIKNQNDKYNAGVNKYLFRGYNAACGDRATDNVYGKTDIREPISPITNKYLHKIMTFAKKNNIKLVFVKLPSSTVNVRRQVNTIKDIVKQEGFLFYDFNNVYEATVHPLYKDAKNITKIVGKYMIEHLDDLKDKQYDPDDKEWTDSIDALEWMDDKYKDQKRCYD
ncbi:MAG: hypothetical protein Ta2D_08190 [Rickettsiales bacterium]|nr:MAG: hypothetical protein Ta2D_08190 [Rickettsiales bacterium]